LPRNVAHIGYFPRPSDAIAQCDIVMSLSTVSESFGRTVLEAMSAGRPVVCYDRGVPPDLVGRDGRAGRVIAINNPKAAADSLLDLASDRAALEIISQEARRRAILLLELARANTWRIFASD
jgi:glycosyltransferase involved in cell wall biosynthesis